MLLCFTETKKNDTNGMLQLNLLIQSQILEITVHLIVVFFSFLTDVCGYKPSQHSFLLVLLAMLIHYKGM